MIDGLNILRGGGVTVMDRLAHAFSASGTKVTVLQRPNIECSTLAKNPSVTVHTISEAEGAFATTMFRMRKLPIIIEEYSPDGLLSFNYHSNCLIPQLTYHINVIPFLPFSQRLRAVGIVRALLQRMAARKAIFLSDSNFYESKYLATLAGTVGDFEKSSAEIAYIGVDLPPVSEEVAIDIGSIADGPIISITSGAPHKRNDLTVAAFQKILKTLPDAELIFVGNTQAIFSSLKVGQRKFVSSHPSVGFTGYLDRSELYSALSRARCLVTFSELESFHMVALEAMNAGCPVVASNTTSAEESMGKAALLFQQGDVAAAARHVIQLGEDSRRNDLIQSGRARAKQFESSLCTETFVRKAYKAFGWEMRNV